MQPRHSRETFRPVLPSRTYSIAIPPTLRGGAMRAAAAGGKADFLRTTLHRLR
jgi:hypothetical protein